MHAVAHEFMQLKTHNKGINHRRRSFVGHTPMALVQLVAHYSLCWKYNNIYVNSLLDGGALCPREGALCPMNISVAVLSLIGG